MEEFRHARNPVGERQADQPRSSTSWHPYHRFLRVLQHLDQRFDARAVYEAGRWVARFHESSLHPAAGLSCQVNEALRPWPDLFRGAHQLEVQTVEMDQVRFRLSSEQCHPLHRMFAAGWLRQRLEIVGLQTNGGVVELRDWEPEEDALVIRPKSVVSRCCMRC